MNESLLAGSGPLSSRTPVRIQTGCDDPIFHFPFDSFSSPDEFQDFVVLKRDLLDRRFVHERSLALAASAVVLHAPGSCGLCLRATSFATAMPEGDPGEPATVVPNWREQQRCACPDRLNARCRGVLQFMAGSIGLLPWMRVLVLGDAQTIEPRLAPLVGHLTTQARSGRLPQAAFDAQPGYHLIVSSEQLHAEPALDTALTALHAALSPGGHLVITAAFDAAAATSQPALGDAPGVLGWDILTRLVRAGFATAAAHLFWSEEFGYLGSFNLIFSAGA